MPTRSKHLVLWILVNLFWLSALVRASNGADPKSSPKTTTLYGKKVSVLGVFGQSKIGEAAPKAPTGNSVFHASGVVVDRSLTPNAIYVIDKGHHRILGFRSYESKKADLIFGQPDEESSAPNGDCNLGLLGKPTSTSLCLVGYPVIPNIGEGWQRIHHDVDSDGNLYVPDVFNDRVLVYYAPFSKDKSKGKGDTVADFVIGQKDFTSNGPNQGRGAGQPNASSIHLGRTPGRVQTTFVRSESCTGWGVSVDGRGNVWVADTFNGRVLRFPKGKSAADLVLGQKDFTNRKRPGEMAKAPLDLLNVPIIARVNPETGELYTVDEYPAGNRILVFKPPFKNGMAADRILTVKQKLQGDYTGGYQLTHATSIVFNPFKTEDWIDPDMKAHRYKDGVVWVCDGSRCMLLDKDGEILLAIAAPDTVTKGGRFDVLGRSGLNPPEQAYNLIWPGGMLGFDSSGNIYLADSGSHRVSRYALPYRPGKNAKGERTIPRDNGGLVADYAVDPVHINRVMGMGVYKNQLFVRDFQRIMVWNDYLSKPIGAPADLFIGQDGGDNIRKRNGIIDFSRGAIDDKDRLWVGSEHGKLTLYQLPFTATSQPLREQIQLYFDDDPGTPIKHTARCMAFDPVNKHLWVSDYSSNRLLRIKNPDDWNGKLLVDAVLGQPDKASNKGNRGQKVRDATGMAKVSSLRFDHLGNFFVVDNHYEGENCRVLGFLAEDMKSMKGMFPNTPAKKIYCADRFDSKNEDVHRMKLALTQPHPISPVSVAFNRKNEMVIGNDGYWGDDNRAIRQFYLYRKPLQKATPDAVIEIPVGAAGEMWFDDQDNFITADPIYQKVWVINFDKDRDWLKPL